MLRAVSQVPVIVGTARDDEHEIVRAARRRRRRVHREAVLGRAGRRADPRAACGGSQATLRRVVEIAELVDRPGRAHGDAAGRATRAEPQGVRPPALPRAPLRHASSPSRSCSPRSGRSRTAGRRRRSTRTCRGCAGKLGESARARRATCTPCAASASSSSPRATEPTRSMRRQLVLMTLAITSMVVIAFIGAARRSSCARSRPTVPSARPTPTRSTSGRSSPARTARDAPELVAQADASTYREPSPCTTPTAA